VQRAAADDFHHQLRRLARRDAPRFVVCPRRLPHALAAPRDVRVPRVRRRRFPDAAGQRRGRRSGDALEAGPGAARPAAAHARPGEGRARSAACPGAGPSVARAPLAGRQGRARGLIDTAMLGLYVHVPFCQAICSYCNFNRGLFDPGLKARYVRALLREIRETGTGEPADTVFFGGGTPSLLEPDEIAAILEACRESFSLAAGAEVTLEANPETVTVERMAGYVAAGVNRVSLGAQSFNQDELVRLGRVHDVDRIGRAVAAAREAGVANLSLDLMFWLPGQSLASWLDSVHRAVALGPEHLSFYLLE